MRGFWYVSSLRKQLRRDRILLYVLSAMCSFPQSAVTVSVSVLSLLHRKKSAFCGRGEGGWRGPGAGAGPPAATAGASALQPAGLCPPRCPWLMLRPDGKGSLRGSRPALCSCPAATVTECPEHSGWWGTTVALGRVRHRVSCLPRTCGPLPAPGSRSRPCCGRLLPTCLPSPSPCTGPGAPRVCDLVSVLQPGGHGVLGLQGPAWPRWRHCSPLRGARAWAPLGVSQPASPQLCGVRLWGCFPVEPSLSLPKLLS